MGYNSITLTESVQGRKGRCVVDMYCQDEVFDLQHVLVFIPYVQCTISSNSQLPTFLDLQVIFEGLVKLVLVLVNK